MEVSGRDDQSGVQELLGGRLELSDEDNENQPMEKRSEAHDIRMQPPLQHEKSEREQREREGEREGERKEREGERPSQRVSLSLFDTACGRRTRFLESAFA